MKPTELVCDTTLVEYSGAKILTRTWMEANGICKMTIYTFIKGECVSEVRLEGNTAEELVEHFEILKTFMVSTTPTESNYCKE